jgi:hypothetical protein
VALDPRITVIAEKYGLQDTDFWELKQKKGTWVAKHAALEVAAVKAGIEFDNPTIIEAKTEAGIAAVCVVGTMPDDNGVLHREWSIGEASPKNNMNAYPWAMAEKRAKDRVILKLIGIHGLVYSEDEMSDADERPPRQVEGTEVKHTSKAIARPIDGEMRDEIDACQTVEELKILWKSKAFQTDFQKHPKDWQGMLIEHFNDAIALLQKRPPQNGPMIPPDFDKLGAAQ